MALTLQDLQGSNKQRSRERLMRLVFQGAALVSIVVSLLILFVLVRGAIDFLRAIDWDFGLFSDTGWFPRRSRFDLRTIVVGSVIMGSVAMLVAVPLGLGTAIYLSEYAPRRVRNVVKPVIEVLAGIPSVIVGYFVLSFVAPEIVNRVFGEPAGTKSMLAAGLGIGILVIPIMAADLRGRAAARCPARCARRATAAGRASSTPWSRSSCRPPCRARGRVHHRRLAGDRRDDGGDHGRRPRRRRPVQRHQPAEPGALDDGRDDERRRRHRQHGRHRGVRVLFFVGLLLFAITLLLNLVGDRFVQRVRQKY